MEQIGYRFWKYGPKESNNTKSEITQRLEK